MDPLVLEALIRASRVVAGVTGALVVIDSVGILLGPLEKPPHKPKWSAFAWLVGGLTVIAVTGILIDARSGFVGHGDPRAAQLSVLGMYVGLASMFTIRAISRAHRPWLVLLSALGMTSAGILYTLGGG